MTAKELGKRHRSRRIIAKRKAGECTICSRPSVPNRCLCHACEVRQFVRRTGRPAHEHMTLEQRREAMKMFESLPVIVAAQIEGAENVIRCIRLGGIPTQKLAERIIAFSSKFTSENRKG